MELRSQAYPNPRRLVCRAAICDGDVRTDFRRQHSDKRQETTRAQWEREHGDDTQVCGIGCGGCCVGRYMFVIKSQQVFGMECSPCCGNDVFCGLCGTWAYVSVAPPLTP